MRRPYRLGSTNTPVIDTALITVKSAPISQRPSPLNLSAGSAGSGFESPSTGAKSFSSASIASATPVKRVVLRIATLWPSARKRRSSSASPLPGAAGGGSLSMSHESGGSLSPYFVPKNVPSMSITRLEEPAYLEYVSPIASSLTIPRSTSSL